MDHIYLSRVNVEVAILVQGGRLPIYEHDGHYWIMGQPGLAYAIQVRISRYLRQRRIEVLESVDGRDVLRDAAATLQGPGMIVTTEWVNAGWRIDDDRVREFVFSDPAQSIAAQATGGTAQVGVIGVAVYNEKAVAPPLSYSVHYTGRMSLDASRSAFPEVKSTSMDRADLGTGMGAEIHDSVGHTHFERESKAFPSAVVEIQYRSYEWLRERGIIRDQLPSAWANKGTGYETYVK